MAAPIWCAARFRRTPCQPHFRTQSRSSAPAAEWQSSPVPRSLRRHQVRPTRLMPECGAQKGNRPRNPKYQHKSFRLSQRSDSRPDRAVPKDRTQPCSRDRCRRNGAKAVVAEQWDKCVCTSPLVERLQMNKVPVKTHNAQLREDLCRHAKRRYRLGGGGLRSTPKDARSP